MRRSWGEEEKSYNSCNPYTNRAKLIYTSYSYEFDCPQPTPAKYVEAKPCYKPRPGRIISYVEPEPEPEPCTCAHKLHPNRAKFSEDMPYYVSPSSSGYKYNKMEKGTVVSDRPRFHNPGMIYRSKARKNSEVCTRSIGPAPYGPRPAESSGSDEDSEEVEDEEDEEEEEEERGPPMHHRYKAINGY